ncbi:GspE/PulE family protein [Helicobacter sp. 11S02596-1]|uniref:GspE/PulE family protein n=1 Tax=Helicobacter sp. 11S02596-1 TaxID=1476194 RepID=UPI000BA6E817|nr:GspE/PulE family protein [Helicobacter sp. 11S02596-1]PAF42358.1 hypothetical protein BJI48_07030 [Helicobacter sp. 11S02596-1]
MNAMSEIETLDFQDWAIDEKSCTLLPYQLACKLKTFVFLIDFAKQNIILAVCEDKENTHKQNTHNQSLLQEIIKQKYPTFAVQHCPIHPKSFYIALEHIKIQEQIYRFSTQINQQKSAQSSIESFYHFILETAILQNASDLHLESKHTHASFKIRKDGKIKEIAKLSCEIFELLCNKIKLQSRLDISEKRLPQDGRYSLNIEGKDYDFRISCVPTQHGESIVMRLLYKQTRQIDLDFLNLSTDHHALIQKSIHSPHGIILITGPTGSGKSTTLYALLETLKSSEKKLITIEDPIEYQIDLATQVQINPDYGFGFPEALRAILRQDPDIIMVGEIRDQETLQLAIQSSLTGHLVLSTIHTNDTASTIDRLLDMGIAPYLLNSSLHTIISQRLVRKLCPHCKKPKAISQTEKIAQEQNAFTPVGCQKCHMQGFDGREAIFEVLEITDTIKPLIGKTPTSKLKEILKEKGFQTLFDDGIRKAREGITTYEEIYRSIKE